MDVQSVQITGPKEDLLCLVVEYPGRMSPEALVKLRMETNSLEERLDVPVVVLTDGMKARAIRKSDADVLDAISDIGSILWDIRESLQTIERQGR